MPANYVMCLLYFLDFSTILELPSERKPVAGVRMCAAAVSPYGGAVAAAASAFWKELSLHFPPL